MTGKRRNTVLRPFMRRGPKAWSLGLAAAAALTFLFYRSALMLPALLPLAFYFAGRYERERGKKRLLETSGQLKDGLLALGASVRAGHSAENAFLDAAKELEFLYGRASGTAAAFYGVSARLRVNVPLEQAVREMAEELKVPEAVSFAEVFAAARRTGGRIDQVILKTVQTLSGRLEVREEIGTLLKGRRYEQKIMKAVPLLILVYMELTSPDYFGVLYGTVAGRIIMTVCLAVYLAAWILADRIGSIEV